MNISSVCIALLVSLVIAREIFISLKIKILRIRLKLHPSQSESFKKNFYQVIRMLNISKRCEVIVLLNDYISSAIGDLYVQESYCVSINDVNNYLNRVGYNKEGFALLCEGVSSSDERFFSKLWRFVAVAHIEPMLPRILDFGEQIKKKIQFALVDDLMKCFDKAVIFLEVSQSLEFFGALRQMKDSIGEAFLSRSNWLISNKNQPLVLNDLKKLQQFLME